MGKIEILIVAFCIILVGSFMYSDYRDTTDLDFIEDIEEVEDIEDIRDIEEVDEVDEEVIIADGLEIIGESEVTLDQMIAWAVSKKSHRRFIEVAPIYWKYGELTGIRADILYAQAAFETGYGFYKGSVPPPFNNWAGIKTVSATGDKPKDHERFDTPEDGVRAHFNHVSAYVGLKPVGDPHDRYFLVKRIEWAGSIKYVEELSGRWAPLETYHEYLIRFVSEMKSF